MTRFSLNGFPLYCPAYDVVLAYLAARNHAPTRERVVDTTIRVNEIVAP